MGCVADAPLFARVDGPLLKANTKPSLETLVTSTYRGRKVAQAPLDLSCGEVKKVKFKI